MKVPTVISGFTCRIVFQILVCAYFSNHFAHSSPELLCMLHVAVPEHKGGLMKFAPAIGLYFLQAMVSCIVGCAFFWQQFKIVFDASILCKRDGLKTHEGGLAIHLRKVRFEFWNSKFSPIVKFQNLYEISYLPGRFWAPIPPRRSPS